MNGVFLATAVVYAGFWRRVRLVETPVQYAPDVAFHGLPRGMMLCIKNFNFIPQGQADEIVVQGVDKRMESQVIVKRDISLSC